MTSRCGALHEILDEAHRFRYPLSLSNAPPNGLYILFEEGEVGHGRNRIVRVGTHIGSNRLRKRLDDHFVKESKDRSIFRKNIGRAILAQAHDPFLNQWENDRTTRAARQEPLHPSDAHKLQEIESLVLRHRFSFVLIRAEDGSFAPCNGSQFPLGQFVISAPPLDESTDWAVSVVGGLGKRPIRFIDTLQIKPRREPYGSKSFHRACRIHGF